MGKHVIIISMEGCGCSYLGALISHIHRHFTGKDVYWNYEISRLHACSNEYPFPKGFSSVYYVDPKRVAQRPFDKIILLRRTLEQIKRTIEKRNKIVLENHPQMIEEIEFYYDLIYKCEISNGYIFDLNEFNKYPVAIFSDLLDFLEYPKKMRPMFLPFPIHDDNVKTVEEWFFTRDWGVYSSILRAGHEEGNPQKDEYTQFINVEHPNPYKLTPEEYYYQKGKVYRITPNLMTDTLEVLDYV